MLARLSPSNRSFLYIFTTAWLLILASSFIYGIRQRYLDEEAALLNTTPAAEPSIPCRVDFFPKHDQCGFVNSHCAHVNNLGLVPYLKWYYCAAPKLRGVLIFALSTWMVLIFAIMATAADKFLAVNLASLVHSLQISENLAGVTIFAFGNGSADLFSTLAATNSGNGSLAIAELFGAAAFITTVVLGSIMIVQPFEVDRKAFLGDVVCFLIAAATNLALISDGGLPLYESFIIIGLYALFVAFVLLRDRYKPSPDIPELLEPTEDPEDIPQSPEAEETTALLPSNHEGLLDVPKLERRSSSASSKHLLVRQVSLRGSSSGDSGASIHSVRTVASDWASEYEHMADVPPFIKLLQAIKSCRTCSIANFLSTALRLPALICIGLTTITQPEIEHSSEPVADQPVDLARTESRIVSEPERHPREYLLLCVQIVLGPQFETWLFWSQTGKHSLQSLYIASLVVLGCSLVFLLVFRKALLHPGHRLHVFMSMFGFVTATSWIYLVAAEAVAIIESFGVISDVSDALLGATIFAIGNSSDDVFANISVAKRGHPILASAACLGSPMLNSLLGIGFGSLIQVIRGNYKPYEFNIPDSLFVSATSLLVGLSTVLFYVLLRGGKLDKTLGYTLMAIWTGFMCINVYVSLRAH